MSQSATGKLSEYKLLEKIGQGGFGDVCRAEGTVLG